MSVIQYVASDAGTFPEDAYFLDLDISMSSLLSGNLKAWRKMLPLIISTTMTVGVILAVGYRTVR
jgi:hypothetical protein